MGFVGVWGGKSVFSRKDRKYEGLEMEYGCKFLG